jgi:hypothetical protein
MHRELNNLCRGLAATTMNLKIAPEKKNLDVRSDTPTTSPSLIPTTVSANLTPSLRHPTPKHTSQLANMICSQPKQTNAQTSRTKVCHQTRDQSKRKLHLHRPHHMPHNTLPKPPAPWTLYTIPNLHNFSPPRRSPTPSLSQPTSLHPITSRQHPKPQILVHNLI